MCTLLIVIIVLSFIFDFINGFHDSANAIATIVSPKVLTPFQAVVWAAFFNFAAFFISKYVYHEFGIGNTVAKWVTPEFVNLQVILAGILAAIIWNLITWWFGIPSSSSHTLMGGFVGAALVHAGGLSISNHDVINYAKVVPTFLFIFLAPLIGMIIAFFITVMIVHICKKSNPYKADKWFKKLQLLSSAAFSLGHGGNDAQKVIALGTLSGGWKIVKTMGTKITKVTPLEGVAAETAGAITLFLTEHFKIPVSTTHTITGSIIGVGATKRLSAVRWGVTINLLWAWVITIPISALMAGIIYYILHLVL